MASDLSKILEALEDQGFTVSRTKKNHIQVRKNGKLITVFAGTASDWRSIKNSLGYCKKAGFIWPPKG